MNDAIKHRLLVVEDDESLRLTLIDNLELEGYDVFSASSISEAQTTLTQHRQADSRIDLIILDLMLPDGSGYELCEQVRISDQNMMIMMLTARTLDTDLQAGFSAGADDYQTKPYKVAELLLRIKALLRRQSNTTPTTPFSLINGFEVHWQQHQITKHKQRVHLTKKEFDLLKFLFDNINQTNTRDEILDRVWGGDIYVEERTVDNFISNIRKVLKLNEPHPYCIRTVRSVGYALVHTPEN